MNGLKHLYGEPWESARNIQTAILNYFGITSVIGIGDNKFLAKVVMDLIAKKSTTGIAKCTYEDVSTLLWPIRSEEHTSELQSRGHLVCRLLLEKKKKKANIVS